MQVVKQTENIRVFEECESQLNTAMHSAEKAMKDDFVWIFTESHLTGISILTVHRLEKFYLALFDADSS